jgi:hypothetical protein
MTQIPLLHSLTIHHILDSFHLLRLLPIPLPLVTSAQTVAFRSITSTPPHTFMA